MSSRRRKYVSAREIRRRANLIYHDFAARGGQRSQLSRSPTVKCVLGRRRIGGTLGPRGHGGHAQRGDGGDGLGLGLLPLAVVGRHHRDGFHPSANLAPLSLCSALIAALCTLPLLQPLPSPLSRFPACRIENHSLLCCCSLLAEYEQESLCRSIRHGCEFALSVLRTHFHHRIRSPATKDRQRYPPSSHGRSFRSRCTTMNKCHNNQQPRTRTQAHSLLPRYRRETD